MRPGILHFKKRTDDDDRHDENVPEPSDAAFAAEEPAEVKIEPIESELNEPRWSLVSFERREAGGLTYPQAARLMEELHSNGMAGLCIVTDAAASRMS